MDWRSRLRVWHRSGSLLVAGVLAASLVGIVFLLRPQAAILHETIDVDGMRREYRLVVPRSVAGERDVPVVFALHGANDTVDFMAEHTGLDELAIEQGFLLVYLQGRHLNWPPFVPPENPTLMEPDAALLRAMCDRVVSEHGGDPRRVYLLGVSQGGVAANLLTAMCSERLAATVVGCGWLPEPLGETPIDTANKCPMLFIVGSRDRQVPPEFVREGYDAFERAGHPVEFRVIEGFGHGWPRRENKRVWTWLARHRLPHAE
jgi:poly(3-hydroxybutyrate) depolymerase